jgi:plasmid stability protein
MQSGCTLLTVPKAIQIRNVPDDVHRRLRVQAAAAGLSLSDYLRRLVTDVAGKPSIAEVIERAQARGGSTVTREDIVAAVRADRGPLPEDD